MTGHSARIALPLTPAERGLTAADLPSLATDDAGLPGRRGFRRRDFFGGTLRAACGLGTASAASDGMLALLTGQQSFVSRAEGAEPVGLTRPLLAYDPGLGKSSPLPVITATPDDQVEWDLFRRRFINADGRVIDTGNNCVSHTEGQGWGLLFAQTFDDPACFERVLNWTNRTLGRDGDALHAWRYVPGAAQPVADRNNATDGDLYIACALWRASLRWGRADYAAQARAIAGDILRLLVRNAGGRTILLPAAFGFEMPEVVTVNPSYYCFTALRDLAVAMPSPAWDRLRTDGLAIIAEGRFGAWRLPPDWLSVRRLDGALAPAHGWPARFSYDAIRVPLQLAWSGLALPAVRDAFTRFWGDTDVPAAWVDLDTGDRASYPAPPGMVAVAKIATASSSSTLPPDFPSVSSSPDYYSAALTLLARVAWQEIHRA